MHISNNISRYHVFIKYRDESSRLIDKTRDGACRRHAIIAKNHLRRPLAGHL